MIINYGKAAPSGVDYIGSFSVKSSAPATTTLSRRYKLLIVLTSNSSNIHQYCIPFDALTSTNKTFAVAYGSGSNSTYRTLILKLDGNVLTIGHGTTTSNTFEFYGLY